MDSIFSQARNAAYKIISLKGYTNSAIGVVIARIVKAILENEKSVIPVSVYWQGGYEIENVCMSLQSVVGIDGVKHRVLPELTNKELKGLQESAQILKSSIEQIEV